MFLQIFLNYATMRSSFAGAFRCHFSFFGSHVLKFDTLIHSRNHENCFGDDEKRIFVFVVL